jgi:hypothetical protein
VQYDGGRPGNRGEYAETQEHAWEGASRADENQTVHRQPLASVCGARMRLRSQTILFCSQPDPDP